MRLDIDPIVIERRNLIKYVLQTKLKDGLEIMLPVGCNAFDDWLLDALDVELLLEKIDQERKIDLTTICDPEHSRPAGRRTSGALLAAHLQETTESMGLMDAQGYSLPRLKVSLLSSQLEEQAQREIAYQIFLNSCPKASDNLLQSLRGQLEINEKRSDELKNIILKVMKNPNENLASLESHLKLLELISPSHFGSFRGYTTWRDGLASLIQLSLVDSVQNSWVQHQEDDMNAHYLISVMKGGFRRLDVKDADDFDERERKDAIAAVSSACREIAARCRNGMAIPWSLRASFAEVLLRGSFDSLDDGALIDEVEELDKILQTKVWPLLEISRDVHLALQVWANYRQFFISKEIHLLQRATQMAEKMSPIGGQSGPSALQIEVLAAIREECVRVLRDYRNLCESPEHVRGILLLLLATAKASVIEEDIPQLLSSCIQSSVTEAIERKSEYFSSRAASEQDQVALLATECLEILRSECEEYGPCLQQWIPNATAISAAALHEAYGGRVLPWIVTVTNLDKNAIAVLSTAMALEDELLMEMINHGMDAPEWGVIDRITPKLYEWTKSQIRMLEEWVMRIRVNEKWNSENKVRGMHGRSIGELLKATHDVVESLFLLGIPIPPGVVRCMVDGVDGILQKFCEDTVGFLGSVDDIVPPAPPLTRFKKDVVDAAEMADKREGSSAQVTSNIPEKSNSALKSITSKVGAVFTSSWLPPLTSEQKKMVMDITFDSLAIRANSLHRVAHCMGSMERTVVQKWESGQPKSSSAKGNLRNLEWASGMFTGVQSAAAKGADSLLHFAALKLLCGHLRNQIFADLYRFNVHQSRIHPILQDVDIVLGDLCEILHEELAPRLAGHFCKNLGAAVAHVLLDGGPVRWFTIGDAEVIAEDLNTIADMFHADGAGLDPSSIQKLLKPATDVVILMREGTDNLIIKLKNEKRQPLSSNPGTANDPEVILRVLCHRKDHAASKYLKKEYKIQKKLPNIISSTVSKSFSRSPATKSAGMSRMAPVTS